MMIVMMIMMTTTWSHKSLKPGLKPSTLRLWGFRFSGCGLKFLSFKALGLSA